MRLASAFINKVGIRGGIVSKHSFAMNSLKIRQHMSMNIPSLNGADIGIPLNIIDNVFTNLHYGYHVTTLKGVVLQFLIGYYTYGKDRYKDALEYFQNGCGVEYIESQNNTYVMEITNNKKELYETLYLNRHFYQASYCVVFYSIFVLLFNNQYWYLNTPAAGLLYSTEYYKQLKSQFVGFKPLFVASMWTFSAAILPCVLHDHNYSILQDVNDYFPCFLLFFACTNLADIKDIDEDTLNGVNTLPGFWGKKNTQMLVLSSLALSSYMFGVHPHYMDRPIVNGVFEIQNSVLSLATFLL